MKNLKAYYYELEGTNYEVGKALGEKMKNVPQFKENNSIPKSPFSKEEQEQIINMFDKYCPGINEEIEGFTDALGFNKFQTIYYIMSFLRPGCSQMALLPEKTKNNHVLLARNYDFNDEVEELILCTTKIKGKYAHIGTSMVQFGRGDGMNECGLGVSQTSMGLPVGNFKGARKPAIIGLQFWAVIRSILENCKDVDEAISYMQSVPIAYNINLMVADKMGNAALIESLDGKKEVKRISADSKEQYLCSTNHVHLEKLKRYEPKSMKNSVVRYNVINEYINNKGLVSLNNLKLLLSTMYPEGLCCHHYKEFFGTLRGMVFDLNDGTVEVCFGSTALNDWHTFEINNQKRYIEFDVKVTNDKAPKDFYELV
ncbi:C45 family autoproteolytic acyltransferase/hydrolase [Clostridiaceae bacterium M8S5]|nr:C45 family autoproteolytic acyltransferase/hydrolase [Clostridiaceae bacterium M8S5]